LALDCETVELRLPTSARAHAHTHTHTRTRTHKTLLSAVRLLTYVWLTATDDLQL